MVIQNAGGGVGRTPDAGTALTPLSLLDSVKPHDPPNRIAMYPVRFLPYVTLTTG